MLLILSAAKGEGVTFNENKCFFSHLQIRLDPEHLYLLLNMPLPRSKSVLQRAWYAKRIPNFHQKFDLLCNPTSHPHFFFLLKLLKVILFSAVTLLLFALPAFKKACLSWCRRIRCLRVCACFNVKSIRTTNSRLPLENPYPMRSNLFYN